MIAKRSRRETNRGEPPPQSELQAQNVSSHSRNQSLTILRGTLDISANLDSSGMEKTTRLQHFRSVARHVPTEISLKALLRDRRNPTPLCSPYQGTNQLHLPEQRAQRNTNVAWLVRGWPAFPLGPSGIQRRGEGGCFDPEKLARLVPREHQQAKVDYSCPSYPMRRRCLHS